MPEQATISEIHVGCRVKAKKGRAFSVNGLFAVEGGIIKRVWWERGHEYCKLIDEATSSPFPNYFATALFEPAE